MFVTEFFQLQDAHVEYLYGLKPKFGYDGFGEAAFYRTYSRIIRDENDQPIGQESWHDVVLRVINGVMSIRKDWYKKNSIRWDEGYWQARAFRMAKSLFSFKWMPAGRGLWAMGTKFVYERGSLALNNCSFTNLGDNDRLADDFHWLMDCLMLGAGVGFEAQRNDLRIFKPVGSYVHMVGDSREGWAQSVKLLVDSYTKLGARKPIFNYSLVRPKGMPIKGFGGKASGPEPLMLLHKQISELFETEGIDEVRLKTDIANLIGVCIVSGNVRRSAEIALGNIKDRTFLDLKDYEKYPDREEFGWMSNNSAKLWEDSDYEMLGEIAKRVIVRGEPGIANLRNFPFGRIGKWKDKVREDKATGLNPCQIADSKLLTPNGIRRLGDLNVGDLIWSKSGWTKIVKKWSTGFNRVYRYGTTAGAFIGTEGHRIVSNGMKVEVKDTNSIDMLRGNYVPVEANQAQAIMDGLLIGDGSVHEGVTLLNVGENDQDYFNSEIGSRIFSQYNKSYQYRVLSAINQLSLSQDRTVPDQYYYGDKQQVCSFLRGLYSANGSCVRDRITLKSSSFKLIEQVQTMLSSIGIASYYTTNRPTVFQHHNGAYESLQSYDLNVSVDRKKFAENIGFIQKHKTAKLQAMTTRKSQGKETYDIISIEFLGEEETFDITVDNASHTYWTQCCNVSNCGEIPLEDKELCNVAETCPTNCADEEEWYLACEDATFYTSTVSLLPTHREETNRVVIRNRRIGVGIIDWTGWVSAKGLHRVIRFMRAGYKRVTAENIWANAEAGVPEAIRKTTIKPGGTTPKLPGLTPGIGYPTFDYTLRRMTVASNSSICEVFDRAGVPSEPSYHDPVNTRIYEFPTLQGPSDPADKVSLWQQAMNLITVAAEWADNAVSNTLYFRPKWKLVYMRSTSFGASQEKQESEVNSFFNEIEDLHREGRDLPLHFATTLEVRKLVNEKWKLSQKKNKWDDWEVYYYEYDPTHEENVIEPVLSATVPHIKSLSLLPHSAKGAYRQMPEEGITQEEYKRRLDAISPPDWSNFRDSDGIDEKFCSGPNCEVVLQPKTITAAVKVPEGWESGKLWATTTFNEPVAVKDGQTVKMDYSISIVDDEANHGLPLQDEQRSYDIELEDTPIEQVEAKSAAQIYLEQAKAKLIEAISGVRL